MIGRLLAGLLCLLIWTGQATADARLSVLMQVLGISDVVQIMHDEGLEYAADLDRDMLDGQGGAFWQAQARRIYAPPAMTEVVRGALEAGLNANEVEAAILFFDSAAGRKIIELENAARRSILDEAVEQAAREVYAQRKEADDPRLALVQEFVEVNDLVTRNLQETMGATLQFYRGLSDGGYAPMSDDEINAEVWSQQEEIRADTESWLFTYLLLAYQPLPRETLEDYITFSRTETGRALNRALFKGYGKMYRDISYALGRALSLSRAGSEL